MRRMLFALLLWPTLASAQTTYRLDWNANTEPDLSGYIVQVGNASGQYTTTVDVGNVTTWPFPADPTKPYYATVLAYNASGIRSAPAVEAIQLIQQPPPPPSDTTGPDAAVKVVRSGKSNNYTATVTTQATDVVTAQFYVDGAMKAALTVAPWVAKLLISDPGSHAVRVELRDAAGNVGAATQTVVR